MRIERVRLVNLRSFAATSLAFAPGLTWVHGPNGAGKSTLIEAVAYALFGVPFAGTVDEADAVRAGERRGEVEVAFVAADVERRVVRRFTVGADGRVASRETLLYRGDDDEPEARGEEEVRAIVARAAGLEDARELAAVYGRALALSPSELARPFVADAEERREYFELAMGLGRYRRAAAQALLVAENFRAQAGGLEDGSRERRAGLEDLAEDAERYNRLPEEQLALAARKAALDAELGRVEAELDRVGTARSRFESASAKGLVAEEAIRARVAELERAEQLLAEAQTARDAVERSRKGYERYRQLGERLMSLEAERRVCGEARLEASGLEARLSTERALLDGEREQLEAALDTGQREMERLMAVREAARLALETVRARQRAAENARTALSLALERALRLKRLVPPPQADQEREAVATLAAELEALRQVARQRPEAVRRVEQARGAEGLGLEALAEVERLGAGIAAPGLCPLLKQPCSNIGGASLVTHFSERKKDLRASAQAALRVRLEAEAELERAERAGRKLEERTRAAAAVSRTAARGKLPAIPWNDILHQLSGLGGVLSALEAAPARVEPLALLAAAPGTAEASAWDELPAMAAPVALPLPAEAELDSAQETCSAGRAAAALPASAERDLRLHELAERMALLVHGVAAQTERAARAAEESVTALRADVRALEEKLTDTRRQLDGLGGDRLRTRESVKSLAPRELATLDIEIALSDRRMKLAALEAVERDIARITAERETVKDDFLVYSANLKASYSCDVYASEVRRLGAEKAVAEARLDDAARDGEELQSAAGVERLRELEAARLRLTEELGAAGEALRVLERERSRLKKRLDGQRGRLREVEALRERADAARRCATRAEELARLYRELAGPMAQVVRAGAARAAATLWATLADSSGELVWSEDYALALRRDGRLLGFAGLSRGEQTLAAVVVRLALLKHLPGLGLSLMDEPTAALDEARKRALAAALGLLAGGATPWLEQLIVVSHEDALVEQRLRLVPDPAGTRVGA